MAKLIQEKSERDASKEKDKADRDKTQRLVIKEEDAGKAAGKADTYASKKRDKVEMTERERIEKEKEIMDKMKEHKKVSNNELLLRSLIICLIKTSLNSSNLLTQICINEKFSYILRQAA